MLVFCPLSLFARNIWMGETAKAAKSIFASHFNQGLSVLLLLLLNHVSRVRLCATHIDGSPPGSPIPGILQARTLEWVAISFSNA